MRSLSIALLLLLPSLVLSGPPKLTLNTNVNQAGPPSAGGPQFGGPAARYNPDITTPAGGAVHHEGPYGSPNSPVPNHQAPASGPGSPVQLGFNIPQGGHSTSGGGVHAPRPTPQRSKTIKKRALEILRERYADAEMYGSDWRF